jgi:probable F420-dependent oxidoreductase
LPTGFEGLILPSPFASPGQLVELVKKAEDMGYDSVFPNDHFTIQKYVAEKVKVTPNYYEPLITLAAAASVTNRITLLTGVVVLPYREPVLLAKQVSTLDQISKGRFILGVGIGAYREEFRGVHPRWKDKSRSAIMDEALQCLKILFTEDTASFSGEFFQFENLRVYPKPFRKPYPIYIGGNSEQGMKRAARFGMGWIPACLSPQAIRERLGRLSGYLENEGRSLADIEVAPQIFGRLGTGMDEATEGLKNSELYRHLVSLKASTLKGDSIENLHDFNLIGTPADVMQQVQRYKEAGVQHITGICFAVKTVEEFEEQMQIFAETVIPAFR